MAFCLHQVRAGWLWGHQSVSAGGGWVLLLAPRSRWATPALFSTDCYPLEWIAFPFSRGSSQLRDRTQVSCMKQINVLNMFRCNRGEWSEGRAIINGEGNSKEHRPSEGGRKEKANSPGRGQSVQRAGLALPASPAGHLPWEAPFSRGSSSFFLHRLLPPTTACQGYLQGERLRSA